MWNSSVHVCKYKGKVCKLSNEEVTLSSENRRCLGLVEMVDEFSKQLHRSDKFDENFLVEEMRVLKEANGIQLPNFLPHYVFLYLLQRRVGSVSDMPINFVNKVWGYLEGICVKVLIEHCGNHRQLLSSMRKAAQSVMSKMKDKFLKRASEMIEMEKITYYTCDLNFVVSWNQLKTSHYDWLLQAITNRTQVVNMKDYGYVKVSHLFSVPADVSDQAFDLKMRMAAYWKIVLKRMVDWMALQLRSMIQKAVNKEMEKAIVTEVMVHGGGIEKMLEEPPSVAKNRERLQKSIALLQESKETMELAMDDIRITAAE
ncbi:hypothetical protein SSX86_022680 [Deinandra increscens subsp. villosa]|uniref:GED domain-containing protein n=1 Tax=Deinandra increscens subsp. villosa TaxID=3103831 RepID=A0AAP0CPE6_9ASTR